MSSRPHRVEIYATVSGLGFRHHGPADSASACWAKKICAYVWLELSRGGDTYECVDQLIRWLRSTNVHVTMTYEAEFRLNELRERWLISEMVDSVMQPLPGLSGLIANDVPTKHESKSYWANWYGKRL